VAISRPVPGINAMPVTFTHNGRQYVTVFGSAVLVERRRGEQLQRTRCRRAARFWTLPCCRNDLKHRAQSPGDHVSRRSSLAAIT